MTKRIAGALLLICGACAAKTAAPVAPVHHVEPPKPTVDLAAAKAKAAEAFTATIAALAAGDPSAYVAGVSEDVVALGTGANELTIGRDALEQAMHAELDPLLRANDQIEASAHDVRVDVSPDGHAAWLAADVDFAVTHGTNRLAIPYRVTAVLVEAKDGWKIVAQEASVAPPEEEGARSEPINSADDIGSGAKSAVKAVSGTDVSALLAPGAVQLVGETPHAPSTMFVGPYTARLLPGGQVAFVIGGVDAPPPAGTALRYRALAVLLDNGGSWRVVQVHISLPYGI
jgi:ketosteroid isomerase-like protein